MPHGEVDGLAGLLVQFAQIRQAQAPDIQLAHGSLPNRETCDSEVMRTFSIAVQKLAVTRLARKRWTVLTGSRDKAATCLASQPLGRFAKKMQQPQPTLKSGNVVITFRTNVHRTDKMKVPNYLMKITFMQSRLD